MVSDVESFVSLVHHDNDICTVELRQSTCSGESNRSNGSSPAERRRAFQFIDFVEEALQVALKGILGQFVCLADPLDDSAMSELLSLVQK